MEKDVCAENRMLGTALDVVFQLKLGFYVT